MKLKLAFLEHLLPAERVVNERRGHEISEHLRIAEIGEITIDFVRKLSSGVLKSLVELEYFRAQRFSLDGG